MKSRRLRVPIRFRWAAVVLAATALLVGSVLPVQGGSVPAGGGGVSLFGLLHVLGYAALAGTLAYALAASDRPGWRVAAVAALAALVYGATIEGVQGMLAHRTFSYRDMVSNGVGATAAAVGWWLLDRVVRSVGATSRPPE